MFQDSFKGARKITISIDFKEGVKDISWVNLGSFISVFRVFQSYFKKQENILRRFIEVSCCMALIVATQTNASASQEPMASVCHSLTH